jgi:branched-chain amino acid transport system ATP-binding protein
MALLEARGLTVSYGGLHANDDIDLDCETGRLVGLIGPNGAGKTTFIDAITGFTPLSAGMVSFDGVDLGDSRPDKRAAMGLVRTFQSLELFEDLTVRDNLLVAAEKPKWYAFLADVVVPGRGATAFEDQVDEALEALGLTSLADAHPGDLSHGQRKLIGVARALAAKPKLLLLDEPAAGLDTQESRLLGRHLRGFLDLGVSLFLIDHDMGLVLNVCDYIYVLDFGQVIAHGPPAQVRSDPAVISAYLGESAGEAQAAEGASTPASSAPTAAGDQEVAT